MALSWLQQLLPAARGVARQSMGVGMHTLPQLTQHAGSQQSFGSLGVQHQDSQNSEMSESGSHHVYPSTLLDDVMACSRKKQTGVSLRYILDFGTQPLNRQMLLSARFLHHELPIRLAHRIAELNSLPVRLSNNIHVQRVKRWYIDSFKDIREFPTIQDDRDVEAFTTMLRHAYARHNAVVPAIAKGVEEYKRELLRAGVPETDQEVDLHSFLDRFFLSRIALRFLAGNHVALFEQARSSPEQRHPDRVGLIHTKCKPLQVVHDAVADAREICMRVRGDAPEVSIVGSEHLTFPYVPSHLHHMVFEIVKNSLRAVAERFDGSDMPAPDISVVVATGVEDITIKVSDQGGGIPRSGVQRLFTYLYTTARSPLPDVDPEDDSYQNLPAVLAGYGCGLSLSRLYARYHGGDIQLFSMQGHGTDCYLFLSRLGNTEEPLPGQSSWS